MRGFRRALYFRLDQRCTGMEFATEMIVKSTLFGARISEIPITLHKDGPPCSSAAPSNVPRRLENAAILHAAKSKMDVPCSIDGAGQCGLHCNYALCFSQVRLAGIAFDVHTLLVATLAILIAFPSCRVRSTSESFRWIRRTIARSISASSDSDAPLRLNVA